MVMQATTDSLAINPTAQQDRRRMQRASAHDDRRSFDGLAVCQHHADGATALEQDAIDQHVRTYLKVGTPACWVEIDLVHRSPAAVPCAIQPCALGTTKSRQHCSRQWTKLASPSASHWQRDMSEPWPHIAPAPTEASVDALPLVVVVGLSHIRDHCVQRG